MPRFVIKLFIAAYLSVLGMGLFCHTMAYKADAHPMMYYVVWDMFCGWNGYSYRNHIIAEGESGQYYSLTPAPWGEFKPFGPLDRYHYDSYSSFMGRIAHNVLEHTEHEPITRVFLVEEHWNKRFNLPEYLWRHRYDEEKDKKSYYHVRSVFDPLGEKLVCNPCWLDVVAQKHVMDNPKLQAIARNSRPYWQVNSQERTDLVVPTNNQYATGITGHTWTPPLGN